MVFFVLTVWYFFVFHFIRALPYAYFTEVNLPSIKSFTTKFNLKPQVILGTTISEHLGLDIALL